MISATSWTTYDTVRYFCIDLSTKAGSAKLWDGLVIDQLTTGRITGITLVSRLDSVARPAPSKICTTESLTIAGILAPCSHIVFSGLAHDWDWMSRVPVDVRSPDTGRSESRSNQTSAAALGIGAAASSSAASNDWSLIAGFPMRIAVLHTTSILRPSRSTPVKPEMHSVAHSPDLQNSMTTALNCSLCCSFVSIQETISVLHKPQFNAPLSYAAYRINSTSWE